MGGIATPSLESQLRAVIRDVPDFPKPGIVFKDITPVLLNPVLFRRTTEALASAHEAHRITHVMAIESRGFLFGTPVAQHLGAALVPVRKRGKLPRRTVREEYALEYGTDVLEMHADAIGASARVLIVDDVLATGGTAAAAARLAAQVGATDIRIAAVMDLSFLPWRDALSPWATSTLISY